MSSALVKATKQELEDLINQKLTYKQIGEIYGCSGSAVQQKLKSYNLSFLRAPKWDRRHRGDLEKAQRIKLNTKRYISLRDGKTFDLEWESLEWPSHCPVLGIELNYYAEGREEGSPSFDQIVPGGGYTKENTRIISWRANRIKNDGTAEEHQKIADYLNSLNNS